MFLHLLEELQEQAISHCHHNDLKNLSLTNKQHNRIVRKYLQRTIDIPERDTANQRLPKQLQTLHGTRILRFNGGFIDMATQIKNLKAGQCQLSRDIYEAMSCMSGLEVLDLTKVKVCDSDLFVLSGCALKLKTLILQSSDITHEGISYLYFNDRISYPTLRTLDKLVLTFCPRIDDEAMVKICSLLQLKTLHLALLKVVSDDGFSHLSMLHKLEDLQVFYCRLGDSGFASVCGLPKLKILNISGCTKISNVAFTGIYNLVGLETLIIAGCAIGGFTNLSALRKLRTLDIGRSVYWYR